MQAGEIRSLEADSADKYISFLIRQQQKAQPTMLCLGTVSKFSCDFRSEERARKRYHAIFIT
ncbi:hypothetical protein [Chryseobacterium indoltheticum]|uniref:hypothetical protein n=1 Tax=Chryseobacterium indoltheticum TaxID=254 RepID=UPI003F496247